MSDRTVMLLLAITLSVLIYMVGLYFIFGPRFKRLRSIKREQDRVRQGLSDLNRDLHLKAIDKKTAQTRLEELRRAHVAVGKEIDKVGY